MKLLIQVILLCLGALSLQASMYVYVEEGVKLPLLNDSIVVYSGSPVKVVSSTDDNSKVIMTGYIKSTDKTKLYATANLKLLLASTKEAGAIKIDANKGVLEVTIPKDNLTDDAEEAWDNSSSRFYEVCTQCHAAKVVGEHTMLEWEGLYGSMQAMAKPTAEDDAYISRFLRAYAKDGILQEED